MRQRKMNFIYVFLLDNQSDWLEISLSHRMNRLFRKHNFDIEMLHSRDGARSANLGRPVVRRCLLSCQKWVGGGCFRHPCIVYWKDSPKKVFFAKDFAVTNKALVLQCFVAVRTFQALRVPIVVQDFQDKSVKNEKTTTCALRYSCCNKWTVIHKLCDFLWNSF